MRASVRVAAVLVRHELLLLGSLVRWVARRPQGTEKGRAFGYARGQGAVMFGLGFVCVVETVGLAVLLRGFPVVHHVFLVLDVYTVLMVAGLYASSVTRPHVLTRTDLRLRRFATVDLCIPLGSVASVRRELRMTDDKRESELDLAIGAQTSVTVDLAEPVEYTTFFGGRRTVRVVRFHADEADELVRELVLGRTGASSAE
ncbi:hypothetical protein [Streptomyces sp. CRN 30]|uniref:hypothetical protein n=1 Tax=Streptomyces sp. CRN 30 TaxID=3075613 RepID=UPI002A83D5C7|nr:hypothetical protein [Streptomyces sp. CRN 30]